MSICKTIISCLLVFLCTCTSSDVTGGATEDGNAVSVTGTVVMENDSILSSAIISFIPRNFNPKTDQLPDSLIDTTDLDGKFYFDQIPVGQYNIYCVDSLDSVALLEEQISINSDTKSIKLKSATPFGSLEIRNEIFSQFESFHVYIPGTFFLESFPAETDGVIFFEGLPEANSLEIILQGTQPDTTFTLYNEVSIVAGETNYLNN